MAFIAACMCSFLPSCVGASVEETAEAYHQEFNKALMNNDYAEMDRVHREMRTWYYKLSAEEQEKLCQDNSFYRETFKD